MVLPMICIHLPEEASEVEEMLDLLAGAKEIAVDTETVGFESKAHWEQARLLGPSLARTKSWEELWTRLYVERYRNKGPKVRAHRDRARSKVKEVQGQIDFHNKEAQKSKSGLHFWENELGALQFAAMHEGHIHAYICRPAVFKGIESKLDQILNDSPCILFHQAQFDWKMLKHHMGIELHCENLFDTWIADFLLHGGLTKDDVGEGETISTSLKNTAKRYLGVELTKDKDIRVSDWTGEWSADSILYGAMDVAAPLMLHPLLYQAVLKSKQWGVFKEECQTVPCTAAMELCGVGIDIPGITAKSMEVEHELSVRANNVFSLLPISLDALNSSKQLTEALQGAGYAVTGTDEKEDLEPLKGDALIDAILSYREVYKLATTYYRPFINRSVGSGDIRTLFVGFKQLGPRTGRYASYDPNAQNIPPEVRQFMIAREGRTLICGDLSTVEPRILAGVSGDPLLLKLFNSPDDFYKGVWAEMMSKPVEEVTKEERPVAKEVILSVIYDKTIYGLSYKLGISTTQAEKIQRMFFRRFQYVRIFIEKAKAEAMKLGEVRTLSGRRRLMPKLFSDDTKTRAKAIREIVNTKIQGTAADAIKLAARLFRKKIKKLRLEEDAQLMLLVHDEMVVECTENEAIIAMVKRALEESLIESVAHYIKGIPVLVGDSGALVGKKWGDLKS